MKTLKQIVTSLLFFGILGILSLTVIQMVYAGSLSLRMTTPPSQTNRNDFPIAFVALDQQGRTVSVVCYKKGPLDGSYSQFGSTINLPAGGGSGTCPVSSVVGDDGVYSFYVDAISGSDTISFAGLPVSVTVNRSSPGNPIDYAKNRIDNCNYKIKFKTANDSGRTVRVELYRSSNTSFDLNNSSRIQDITIGSNTEKETTDTVDICTKDYYYRLRAFDVYGNASGSVGDTVNTKTIYVTPTGTVTQSSSGSTGTGALLVASGKSQVTKSNSDTLEPTEGQEEGKGSILGEASPSTETSQEKGFFLFDWFSKLIQAIINFFKGLFS